MVTGKEEEMNEVDTSAEPPDAKAEKLHGLSVALSLIDTTTAEERIACKHLRNLQRSISYAWAEQSTIDNWLQ